MVGRKTLDWKLAGFLFCGTLLCITPARANDINFGAGLTAWGEVMTSVIIAYAVSTFIIEGILLNMLLKQGWGRSFALATVANIVSATIGLMWYVAQGGFPGGWKEAFAMGSHNRLALLFVRSYLITVAEETVVVGLMLGKSVQFKTTFKAVAITNLISYVLTAFLIAILVNHPD